MFLKMTIWKESKQDFLRHRVKLLIGWKVYSAFWCGVQMIFVPMCLSWAKDHLTGKKIWSKTNKQPAVCVCAQINLLHYSLVLQYLGWTAIDLFVFLKQIKFNIQIASLPHSFPSLNGECASFIWSAHATAIDLVPPTTRPCFCAVWLRRKHKAIWALITLQVSCCS